MRLKGDTKFLRKKFAICSEFGYNYSKGYSLWIELKYSQQLL